MKEAQVQQAITTKQNHHFTTHLFCQSLPHSLSKLSWLTSSYVALNNENNLNQFTLKQLFEVISSSFSNFLVTHGLKSLAAKTQSHQENPYQVSSQA